ncbi:MAG: tRNA (N6-isopentenyl adenosine(37)-C2)-methylthiotransferase MiaB [Candidatus Anaerobiospirillum pullicola]|uniref:tRNA-2-methylthio-N(6)-dimethylallyladenosine synthase n=1 Tax=Candidatus Anaerobiospirillum pullicola TaxID=2838451 RepID=A0A948WZ71_9GAMM|nr:tRNA (N6-isopentenyl adenosine(37)-C2)-methylthiotransferase MiaB [Candidatus Anaerobiospirillum pullicola]
MAITTTDRITLSPNLKIQQGTFHVAVWGCQMNVYDADRIRDLMSAAGYVEQAEPNGADIIILVTCAVRAKAEDKVFNQLGAWRHQGVTDDHTIIALGGCVGAELAEQILKLDPTIAIVFGPRTAHRLPHMVSSYKATGDKVVDVQAEALEKFDALPEQGQRGPSAFVTIMEGCSNKCSYCIVPYTRGEEDSRPEQDILDEIVTHIDHGVKEINLLGQNVNSYRGLTPDGQVSSFANLLYEVAAIPGLERLRFTTSNPMEFTDDIIAAIHDLPVIADYIHIPVQSGSDRILKLMRRNYTADSYRELVAKLRQARPNIYISTDIIVGFPGETDEDFAETMRLVNDVKFDSGFSFIYSKRPGTPAAELDDPVPLEHKKQNLYVLQETLEKYAQQYSQGMLGTTQRVLVEGVSRKNAHELKARTSNNRVVILEGDRDLIGQMVTVNITEVMTHTLRGVRC